MTKIAPEIQKIINTEKNRQTAMQQLLNQGLSPEKIKSMQMYVQSLRNQYPMMCANKIKQRVTKKYGLTIK